MLYSPLLMIISKLQLNNRTITLKDHLKTSWTELLKLRTKRKPHRGVVGAVVM